MLLALWEAINLGARRAIRAFRHGAEAQTTPRFTSIDSQIDTLKPSQVVSLDLSAVIE